MFEIIPEFSYEFSYAGDDAHREWRVSGWVGGNDPHREWQVSGHGGWVGGDDPHREWRVRGSSGWVWLMGG